MQDLVGKVALVTGAAIGIGLVAAFAAAGTLVVAVDIAADRLAQADAVLAETGADGIAVALDVRLGAAARHRRGRARTRPAGLQQCRRHGRTNEVLRSRSGGVELGDRRQHGGLLSRQVEGRQATESLTLVELPLMEAARRWYRGPEYQAIIGLRTECGNYEAFLFEGMPLPAT
jgi:NAD(P)-dependent dehydrogenase (short-subunit alcohol dehydrogenase family)